MVLQRPIPRIVILSLPLLTAVAWSSACANAPEHHRLTLFEQGGMAKRDAAQDPDRLRDAVSADIALLREGADDQPSLRWQAARNLGAYGDVAAYPVLRERCLSAVADDNASVRKECALGLGKLRYTGPHDERRLELVQALMRRIAFERTGANGDVPVEQDPLVRHAMLDTLIQLGLPSEQSKGRGLKDVAAALQSIATRLYEERESVVGETNRGLVEAAIEGLVRITGTPPQEVAIRRADMTIASFLYTWWLSRIEELPHMDTWK